MAMTVHILRGVGAAALWAGTALASDDVAGTRVAFTSPNGVTEHCVRIARIPGAAYHHHDDRDEAAFCAVDLYADTVALCPKTWSTSPGMIVYDIASGEFARQPDAFELTACARGKDAKAAAAGELAKFKPTMNRHGTSGTYAPASLLYYHFSRYFDMQARVPVAVWRSMDRAEHLGDVARRGADLTRPADAAGADGADGADGAGDAGGTAPRPSMIHTAWQDLVDADTDPSSYDPPTDLFTADLAKIYGVMLTSPGHRYGPEINGTRASGWGAGQNRDFQDTPAFLALRSDLPIAQAIAAGLDQGRADPTIAAAVPADTPPQQMAFWMRELSEIVLMDFIFSQQDRVGNVDFEPYLYWADGGRLHRKKAAHHQPGDGTVPADAVVLRRTMLNDNDAGVRVPYADFAKSTGMLDAIRHFDAGIYARLMALDADLRAKGPLYRYVADSFGLSDAQVAQIVTNTGLAAGILRDACGAGRLHFDLDPEEFFLTGDVSPQATECAPAA